MRPWAPPPRGLGPQPAGLAQLERSCHEPLSSLGFGRARVEITGRELPARSPPVQVEPAQGSRDSALLPLLPRSLCDLGYVVVPVCAPSPSVRQGLLTCPSQSRRARGEDGRFRPLKLCQWAGVLGPCGLGIFPGVNTWSCEEMVSTVTAAPQAQVPHSSQSSKVCDHLALSTRRKCKSQQSRESSPELPVRSSS